MKIIFASLIVLLFLSSAKEGKLESNLLIQPTLKRSYDTSYLRRGIGRVRAYDINLFLVNKTEKPISFWIMKCSWQDNFVIDEKDVHFYAQDCDGNFPTIKNINANDSIVYTASIHTRLTDAKKTKEIRIGFVFVDSARFSSFDDYLIVMKEKSKQDSIIWSVPLQLK